MSGYYYDESDPMAMYQAGMMNRGAAGGRPRRFDE